MRKNITYVARERFEAIASKLGLPCLEQAGFVKVSGAKGRNMYVARTKRVGRVDLSGFVPEGIEGVTVLPEGERFGAVHAQLDFSRTEKEILATYAACLKHMKKLPERVVEKKSVGGPLVQNLRRRPGWRWATQALDPGRSSKAERMWAQAPWFQGGRVLVPKSAPWLYDYRRELLRFTGNRKLNERDNRVDATSQLLRYFGSGHAALALLSA